MKAILTTLCLMLFAATTLQAQNFKPYKTDNGKYGFAGETSKTKYPLYMIGSLTCQKICLVQN